MSRWTDPAWRAEAEAWLRGHVAPVGPVEQPHVRPWATALRECGPHVPELLRMLTAEPVG